MAQKINNEIEHLYIHIPFCNKICFYCDFFKQIKPNNKLFINDYISTIVSEINNYEKRLNNIKTIYIGGGTPSCLNFDEINPLFNCLNKFKKIEEFSIEVNPDSVDKEKLKFYLDNNINRLSIGAQSFNNDLLKKIGRTHDTKTIFECVNFAKDVGFKNISIDLIYNLPNQNENDILNDLKMIKELNINHISWYSLILKEESIWGKNKIKMPSNSEIFDDLINKKIKTINFEQYEISSYAKQKCQSIHNLGYWKSHFFAGIGVGACGFEIINNKYYLTQNIGSVKEYEKQFEEISQKDYYFNILMMGLRLVGGINLKIENNYNAYIYFEKEIKKNIDKKLLIKKGDFLKCTEYGLKILDSILVDII